MTIASARHDRTAYIANQPGWLTHHANRVAKQFHLDPFAADDVHGDAALFILDIYPADRFDPSRYPREEGETDEQHRVRVHRKLLAHAGVSLCRWLVKQQLKRKRGEQRDSGDPEDFVDLLPDPSSPEPGSGPSERAREAERRSSARVALEYLGPRCRESDHPYAAVLNRVVEGVLDGRSLETVLAAECPRRREWRKIIAWAQEEKL